MDEEEGSAHLVKRAIEMQGLDEDFPKNRSLFKGSSLPKPAFSRQYSVNKIVKTLSLSPYELQSGPDHEHDVKNGPSTAQ